MPYPPTLPPTGQTDTTSSGTGHHADVLHNRTGQALADIVAELGNDPSGTDASVQARIERVDGRPLAMHVGVLNDSVTMTNASASPGDEPALDLGRVVIDGRRATNFRATAVIGVSVAANGVLFQFSTDGGTAWATLVDMGTGFTNNVQKVTAWTAMPAAAKVDNLLVRVMVYGDGVADPIIRKAQLLFGAP